MKAAYAALAASPPSAAPSDPAACLLAADIARLSGHPAAAIPPLRTMLERFPSDARTPLAAFTLGKLLDGLDRPREAAAAFEAARQLRPDGSLAEEALAREVDAWLRAGDKPQANLAAQEYFILFPRGAHASEIRRALGPD